LGFGKVVHFILILIIKVKTMLKIDVSESSSIDDPLRKELLWENREESLIEAWCVLANQKSEGHAKAAIRYKRLNTFWGMSSLLMNVLFAGGSMIQLPEYIPTIGFVVTGSLAAVCTFFEFAGKREQHNDYSKKYAEFCNALKVEMCKPKAFRIACDVFLAKTEMTLNSLNRSAPDL
jgi:hypothetical protein